MAGLFDLPDRQAPPDPEQEAAAADYQDRQQELEEADGLKDGILRILEQGTDPQIVLYTAVRANGLYSRDPEFTKQAYKYLDAVYGDLAQQSFIVDNAAIAAGRLKEQAEAYRFRLMGQLTRQRNEAQRILKGIEDTLTAINTISLQDALAPEIDLGPDPKSLSDALIKTDPEPDPEA